MTGMPLVSPCGRIGQRGGKPQEIGETETRGHVKADFPSNQDFRRCSHLCDVKFSQSVGGFQVARVIMYPQSPGLDRLLLSTETREKKCLMTTSRYQFVPVFADIDQ